MKRPVAKISNHLRRLATFASDVIDHSRRLAKVANLRFTLLRVQSKRTLRPDLPQYGAVPAKGMRSNLDFYGLHLHLAERCCENLQSARGPAPVVQIFVECWGDNLQFYHNFALFSTLRGMNLDQDFFFR